MPVYRVLRAPEPVEETQSSTEEVVSISRAELDALRARYEDAAQQCEARRHSDESDEFRPSGAPTAAEAQVDLDDFYSSQCSEVAALKERESALSRELAEREQRAASLERAYRAALRDRELATALAGRPLLPGAAAQLAKLWRDEFDVHEDTGEYQIAARDGRTVGQAVADWLSKPEYAHFCQPTTKGGCAAGATERPVTASALEAEPKNLGEAVVRRWHEAAARRNRDTPGPIGLGRRRAF
jgi:hypothetical protein